MLELCFQFFRFKMEDFREGLRERRTVTRKKAPDDSKVKRRHSPYVLQVPYSHDSASININD